MLLTTTPLLIYGGDYFLTFFCFGFSFTLMERIKAIFRTNIRAIVFFGIILFGVLSFISSRNQEIEKIKTLQTFADGSFGLIENEYGIITNKTLIADDTAESYDKIIQDLKNLQLQVDEIIQSVPKQNNSSSTYDETVNNLEYFLGDIFVTLTIEMDRYEQEKIYLMTKRLFGFQRKWSGF
ncbi:hypothetical protein HC766_02390 [Candidatus Gracilibacteria bacterium]|nr:hypothetical protein [Candidatus Gracilibacteria bacterium]